MSDRWAILEGGALADIRLGDQRSDVRRRLGEFRVFRRTPKSPETDQFLVGVLATYADNDEVIFIELTSPAQPSLGSVELLGRSLTSVIDELRGIGVEVARDTDGAHMPAWGVGLYAPNDRVEGVSIGESTR